jgi:hypothetical protein
MADSPILTWVRLALIQILLAQVPSKTIIAKTFEVIDQVNTSSSIETGQSGAVISIDQTVSSFKSWPALALITSISIMT